MSELVAGKVAGIDTKWCDAADRPFTDSEVRFLKYIRQWGKKVVFLVNKVDILSGGDEVGQALSSSLLSTPLSHIAMHASHHTCTIALSVLF